MAIDPMPSGGYPTSTYLFTQKSGVTVQTDKLAPGGNYVWTGSSTLRSGGGGQGHSRDSDMGRGGSPSFSNLDEVAVTDSAYLMIGDWDPEKVARFQGANGLPVTGMLNTPTRQAWKEIVDSAATYYSRGKKISPEMLAGLGDLSPKKKPGPGQPGGGPLTTTSTSLTDRGQAKRILNEIFKTSLGRAVSESEVTAFQKRLNDAQAASPSVTSQQMSGDGGSVTSNTSGGMDPIGYALDYAQSGALGTEANTRRVGVDYMDAALKAISAPVNPGRN